MKLAELEKKVLAMEEVVSHHNKILLNLKCNKIKWFMELAIKMRELGYSDTSIYSIDIDAWDEYRVNNLTPEQAIAEDESNG